MRLVYTNKLLQTNLSLPARLVRLDELGPGVGGLGKPLLRRLDVLAAKESVTLEPLEHLEHLKVDGSGHRAHEAVDGNLDN